MIQVTVYEGQFKNQRVLELTHGQDIAGLNIIAIDANSDLCQDQCNFCTSLIMRLKSRSNPKFELL